MSNQNKNDICCYAFIDNNFCDSKKLEGEKKNHKEKCTHHKGRNETSGQVSLKYFQGNTL